MSVPYVVILASVEGRFIMSAAMGVVPDRSTPMVLMDGLTFTWETTDSRLPGTFEPSAVSFAVAALSASSLEAFRVGERFQFWLQVGTGYAIQRTFTITDVEVSLDPHARRKAQARITGVDSLAELRSRFADPLATHDTYAGSNSYGQNLAAIARSAGFKLYAPLDCFDMTSTTFARPVWPGTPWPQESVDEALAQFLDSGPWTAQMSVGPDRHMTILPVETTPAGTVELVQQWYGASAVDPVSWNGAGYVIVPHDRKQSGIDTEAELPLAPTAAGDLTGSGSAAALPYVAALDACHVEAPATGRRGRGSGFTSVTITGQTLEADDEGLPVPGEGNTQLSSRHRAQYGTISREVKAFAMVKIYEGTGLPTLEADVAKTAQGIAQMFLSPECELAQATQLDAFRVRLSDMSPAAALGTILGLTPAPPGSSGIESMHRSTTPTVVYDLPADIFPRTRYWGHTVAGELTIDRGELAYTIVMLPGCPELIPTTTPAPAHRYTDSLGSRTYAQGSNLTYTELQLTRRNI